ncbi:phosphopantetheine-binding protein [Nostoc sp. CHAB 5715]|uniref:phosphopantetheine-binding protein n=1 Tax=Nostoc sp. CHAB 5715 TaxID=2780400 RepID=UPI001E48640B|nr:phosphopantetheine-binding protein [Nostoc sp. CHAB 5715]
MYQPPKTEIEQTIAELWKNLLKLEDVGIHDNFFELGGHSLLLLQVHSKLRGVWKRDLSLLDLFRYPTINSLANYFNQMENQQPSYDIMASMDERIADGKTQQRKRLQKIKSVSNI